MQTQRAATLKQIADGAEIIELDDCNESESSEAEAIHLDSPVIIQIKQEEQEETPGPDPTNDSPIIIDTGEEKLDDAVASIGRPTSSPANAAATSIADASNDAVATNETPEVNLGPSIFPGRPGGQINDASTPLKNTQSPLGISTSGSSEVNIGSDFSPARPDGPTVDAHSTPDPSQETLLEMQKTMAQMYRASNPTTRLNTSILAVASAPVELSSSTECSTLEIEYKQAERDVTRKRALGTLKPAEEISLMRLGQKYNAQKKKLPRQTAEPGVSDVGSDALFVPAGPTRNAKAKPKGKRKSLARSQESEGEEEDEHTPAKKARASKKSAKKPSKATTKPRKGKKNRNPYSNGLLTNSVIEDAAAAEDLEDQPGWDPAAVGKDRAKALRALVAKSPAHLQKVAQTDKQLLNRALQDFNSQGSVKPAESGLWRVPGMKTSLQPHQVLTTAFLRRRENGTEEPRGGILADSMGLGKTLMLLANIVNGRPSHNRAAGPGNEPQTTLIVVPPALLGQWISEINKHTTRTPRHKGWGVNAVLHYRENDQIGTVPEDLTNNDIVITTYNEVAKSWPSMQPPEGLTDLEEDEWNLKEFQPKRGVLHRTHFLRVCLDEAHLIRNTDTKTYAGCRALVANHYWAATGTPMVNGSSDLYALFQFIRHPAVQSSSAFKKRFVNKLDPHSTEKLTEDLKVCMTHATHRDQLFGSRLVNLPKATGTQASLGFTRLEREVYTVVQSRFQQRVQRYIDEDTIDSKMQHIFVLTLRLRQLTSHCLMISEVLPWLEAEDFDKLEEIVKHETRSRNSGKKQILWLRDSLIKTKHPEEGTIGQEYQDGLDVQYGIVIAETQTRQPGGLNGTGKSHGNNIRFEPYLEILKNCDAYRFKVAGNKCTKCGKKPVKPWITICHHVYCNDCLNEITYRDAELGHSHPTCQGPSCDQILDARPMIMGEDATDEDAQAETEAEDGTSRKQRTKKDPIENWKDKDGEVLASTKSIACKAQILNWWDESAGGDPTQKVIIFSQWVPMMHLLMRMCEVEGWGYCTLVGGQSKKKRQKEIDDFTKFPEKRILISSLKCGGLGLNLTMANKVINVEPWWNQATEQQAFCRVFRIGQTRETELVSLTIKDTVDEKLVQIKEGKTEMIDEVMKGHKKLTREVKKQILSLLGDIEEDANGRLFFTNQAAPIEGETEIEDVEVEQ